MIQTRPTRLMLFPTAVKHDAAVERWFDERGELGNIARRWFEVMRRCGNDVRELLHDGHPTACVGEAAFGYTNAFTAHVNVGFFLGAILDDPQHLLAGPGKFMRQTQVRPESPIDEAALTKLIRKAYSEMKEIQKR